MKKEIRKLIYKRWWFWFILLVVVLFLIIETYMYLLHIDVIHRKIKCDEPQNLVCLDGDKIIKDKIPCTLDEDCRYPKANEFCVPDEPSFTDCIGEKDYCGEDGFCKQCMCK